MAKFLTGKELSESVYDILFEAKRSLMLISPFIKLDDYFKKEIFEKHKLNPDLHILLAFGKNERDPSRSFKEEDLTYFKEFPNITIVYVPNLHAKYYANESQGIITSMNLYDFSFKNNVEFGVIEGVNLIGKSIDEEAWDKSHAILEDNFCVYVNRPIYKKKLLLLKDYMGSRVQLDLTDDLINGKKLEKINFNDFLDEEYTKSINSRERQTREDFEKEVTLEKSTLSEEENIFKNEKLLSATALGKLKNKNYSEVVGIMMGEELISNDKEITLEGKKAGISVKSNANGDSWLVYPESLKELL